MWFNQLVNPFLMIAVESLGLGAAGLLLRRGTTGGNRAGARSQNILTPRWIGWLASRPRLAMATILVIALSGCATTAWVRYPIPRVHDEFSYLLAGDTFAHGRLTNPPHAMAKYFETFHVLQQPTYMSKYPPGQGMVLALGQALFGSPLIGVWMSLAMAVAATYWMLNQWLPPRWALLGGWFTAINFAWFGYWGHCYWGGAVAMTGGALLFGAIRAAAKRTSIWHGVAMGLGLLILANSRPLEGLIASVAGAFAFGICVAKGPGKLTSSRLLRVALPAAGVLTVGFAWMAYYNYRITGNAFRLPYQVHQASYHFSPAFVFSAFPEPEAQEQDVFSQYREALRKDWVEQRKPNVFVARRAVGLLLLSVFHLRIVLLVPLLLTLRRLIRSPWFLGATCVGAVVLFVVLLQFQPSPRKIAPVSSLGILLGIQALRYLWVGGRRRPLLREMVRGIPLVLFASLALSFLPASRMHLFPQREKRQQISQQLEAEPGRHLVLVCYGPKHNPHFDWVYNRADIDGAKIVWARVDASPDNPERLTQIHDLLQYFHDRCVWLVVENGPEVQFSPFIRGATTR